MSKDIIILSGLGELEEQMEDELRHLANRYRVQLYPTYYDWELEGERSAIEAITIEMWGMPADEWAENLFQEEAK